MHMSEYQTQAHTTAVYPVDQAIQYTTISLAGEVGEFCNKLKKLIRDKGVKCAADISPEDRAQLAKELGGVLWYLAESCTVLGLLLEDVAQANLDQLASRQKRNTIHGSGDDR